MEIDPIRVELMSTEMPIHQLAKRGEEGIRILKRKRGGQIQSRWSVDYNLNVGRPGQLAYRLDTWVIKRRLSELPRPFPRLIRIGDLREVARELNHGGDTNAVRRAFDQNASTFIRAKVTYQTTDKEQETLEGYFNRYNVFYRGHALPGGRHAETVYISLNDPYYGLLNKSEIRPLDFAYLRQLTPAAQRFYELVSPKIFAVLKNGRSTAWIRYSDYCQHAVQKPQPTRSRMQAQMGAVQRPHRQSGYIASVKYKPSPTVDGALDWIIEYEPGPRARAEHRFFNESKSSWRRTTSSVDGGRAQLGRKLVSESPREPNSTRSDADPSRLLALRFAERRNNDGQESHPTPRQVDTARQILRAVGDDIEIAKIAIDLGAKEGREDRKGFPKFLGGILQGGYPDRARKLHQREKRRRARAVMVDREREHHERYEEWCSQRVADRIAELAAPERRRLIDERLEAVTKKQQFYLQLSSWAEERKHEWLTQQVIREYGREDTPSYEEWCDQFDKPPLH